MTDAAAAVAEQAGAIAAAWSPADAPSSWRLTAAQFEALRDDPELAAIAADIPPEKLPPLLFQAAAAFLVLQLRPSPLRSGSRRSGSRSRRSGGPSGPSTVGSASSIVSASSSSARSTATR